MQKNTNTQSENTPFVAITNKDKSAIVAFVNIAKGYDMEDVVSALNAKGVNAEIRTPNTEVKSVEL